MHSRLRIAAYALLLIAAALGLPRRASAQPTRRVFVEGYRASDSLSRRAAADLRAELIRRMRGDSVHIMTTAEIHAYLAAGAPDDFGQTWSWRDVREVGRLYRATVIVDVAAREVPMGVRIEATRLLLSAADSGIVLPAIAAGTLEEAVALLAKQLAADTVLVGRK
jgi:hypothetical protein